MKTKIENGAKEKSSPVSIWSYQVFEGKSFRAFCRCQHLFYPVVQLDSPGRLDMKVWVLELLKRCEFQLSIIFPAQIKNPRKEKSSDALKSQSKFENSFYLTEEKKKLNV